MDCVRASQLISDALDGLAVDRCELSDAKEHCRECRDCAAYVRALIAVQKTPLPEPPADLPDRIMQQVREEAQAKAVARARALATPRDAAVTRAAESQETPKHSVTELRRSAFDPRNRRQLVAWAGAAAALFILAGWGAIVGVRAILIPPRLTEITITGTDSSSQYSLSAPESAPDQDRSAAGSLQAQPAPDMIEVAGSIYRLAGQNVSVDVASLEKVGRARTALGNEGRPDTYEVLSGTDPVRVYIATDAGTYEFQAVTRDLDGRRYVLKGSGLERYGEWPSLPSGMVEPTSADGTPTFQLYGTDGNNTPVYVLSGRSPAEGIALAPNPPSPDPMAGSPKWTWWVPLPEAR